MYRILACLIAASFFFAGCNQTTKDTQNTETTHKDADGKTVKTETKVEKKTTVAP